MLVVGRQYALIKKCALNRQVRLITRVYGNLWNLGIKKVGGIILEGSTLLEK